MSYQIRFGSFELDPETADMRTDGRTVRLPDQQFHILQMLLARDGGVVSREEIRKRLWPNDTVVEFDRSINAAIMKLRVALGDTADNPRFIETLARRGYRFLIPVENDPDHAAELAAPAVQHGSLVGLRILHYRVLNVLGGGGMGLVYRGEDLKLNRPVALKFLPEEVTLDAATLGRFEREARTASALNHPNICTIYQVDEYDGRPFIVMELLEGETLRSLIARHASGLAGQRGIPLGQLIDIALHIAEGLDAAHRKGIVHRDIKPANIFLTTNGLGKILDFGLAKVASGTASDSVREEPASVSGSAEQGSCIEMTLSRTGIAQGTAGYMSPEQVRGELVDSRTDLFSFGLVLFEMATGERAFGGDTAAVVQDAILRATPPSVRSLNPALPASLERLVARALEKDRSRRWQTAAEMRTSLADLRANLEASDGKDKLRAVVERNRSRRSLLRRLALGMSPAVVLTGIVLIARSGNSTPHIVEYVQITHDGRIKSVDAIDGTRIYFNQQSPPFLAQMAIAGGEVTPVAIDLSEAWLSGLSPDGSTFLVISQSRGEQIANSLWTADLRRGSVQHLADGVNDSAWSPDGSMVMYSTFTGEIDVISRGGKQPRRIAVPGGMIESLSWSPDGRTVRFSKDRSRIWEMGADGSNPHPMLPDSSDLPGQTSGSYTRDGRFAFVSGGEIWMIDRPHAWPHGLWPHATPKPVQLTHGPIRWANPLASADGSKIFAVGATPRGELTRYNTKAREFNTFLGGISAEFLAFSPDGKSVAYVTYPEGILWKANRDGTGRMQLTVPPVYPKLARWSPDGRLILFQDNTHQGRAGIYTVTVDGSGTPQRLMPEDREGEIDPNWAPDGRRIVFCTSPEGLTNPKLDLRILDLASHTVSVIPGSDGLWGPRWSPDGKSISAVTLDSNRSKIFDLTANRWASVNTGSIAFPEWSHDSRYLYYLSWLKDPGVFRVRVPAGKPERVADLIGRQYTGFFTSWMGLDPTDTPMVLRETGTTDIYALTLNEN
jgi:serine/threonine protein kinase